MATTTLNIKMLAKFHEEAEKRGINFTTEARQAGRNICNQAWVRNGSGEEANVHVQIELNFDSNTAYVYILTKKIPKFEYLNDKVKDQNLVEEFNIEQYGVRANERVGTYSYNDIVDIHNEASATEWINRVFDHVEECLKVVSNLVY